jgi:hypothetical protein
MSSPHALQQQLQIFTDGHTPNPPFVFSGRGATTSSSRQTRFRFDFVEVTTLSTRETPPSATSHLITTLQYTAQHEAATIIVTLLLVKDHFSVLSKYVIIEIRYRDTLFQQSLCSFLQQL